MASWVSQKRAALSETTSRTGWMSVGEPAITLRIAPVAVCCSSVSESSRLRASSSARRRAFSRRNSSSRSRRDREVACADWANLSSTVSCSA